MSLLTLTLPSYDVELRCKTCGRRKLCRVNFATSPKLVDRFKDGRPSGAKVRRKDKRCDVGWSFA